MGAMGARRKAYAEERQRQLELAEYFASRKWEWRWKDEVPVQTRKTRKLFKDEEFMLMRPKVRRVV